MKPIEKVVEDPPGVTVLVSHSVRPGKEVEFKDWCEGIRFAAKVHDPTSTTQVFEPKESEQTYHIVFTFSSSSALQGFRESAEGKDWHQRLSDLTNGPSDYRMVNGLNHWFNAQDNHKPSTHKMAVVAFFAIAPLVLVVPKLLGPILGVFPPLISQILSTAVIVVLMSYVAMPLSSRLFSRWLR